MNLKPYLARLKNVGTIIAITSAVILLLTTCGVQVNDVVIMGVVKGLCAIGVLLGILNKPETDGVDLPILKK
jgi:uncharacterized membrane protein